MKISGFDVMKNNFSKLIHRFPRKNPTMVVSYYHQNTVFRYFDVLEVNFEFEPPEGNNFNKLFIEEHVEIKMENKTIYIAESSIKRIKYLK